jgi:competence protein CoiA
MKFALINSNKVEATKGSKGICPSCGAELIAKCGELKIHHWAHKGIRNCDPWWENETEWHRLWKGYFPFEWQEVIHTDKNGEKHIADVKTEEKWVLEFQHSPIKSEERHSRNIFYSKIVWIVDGLRRERDRSQFQTILNESARVKWGHLIIHRVSFPKESRLLNEWLSSGVPIFFDFQESKELKHSRLWFLIPKISNDIAYLMPFSGNNFIELHNNKGFDEMAYGIIPKLRDFLLRYEQSKNQISFYHLRRYRRRF